MKKDNKFNFWVFAMGVAALLIGIMRSFLAGVLLSCDAFGIGEKCVVPQTKRALHVLLDVVNVSIDLFILGLGVALIVYTLRPVFKKKSTPEALPQFPGEYVQKFYVTHPTSKIAAKVGIGLFSIMTLFCIFLFLWGVFDFVSCYLLHFNCGTYDVRDMALTVLFLLMSLIPMAGIWKFYSMLKNPIFCVSEEGLQTNIISSSGVK